MTGFKRRPMGLGKAKRARGFALLDALFAFVLLSIGILGIARVQADAIKQAGAAYVQTTADMMARQMFERMRLNPLGVTANQYDNVTASVSDPGCSSTSAGCTPSTLAASDINAWYASLASSLPNGSGSIMGGGYNSVFTVTVSWSENAPGGAVARTWVVRGRL